MRQWMEINLKAAALEDIRLPSVSLLAMNVKTLFLSTLVAAAMAAPSLAKPVLYDLDGGGDVTFQVRYLTGQLKGSFQKYQGSVRYDPQNEAATLVKFTVHSKSIYTGDEQRDLQLKGPDFFAASKFPTLTFKSGKVKSRGAGQLDMQGILTIRGVSKPVQLPLSVKLGSGALGVQTALFSGGLTIKRKDFGINGGGAVVGDDVQIKLNIEVTK
jgi:polyisoprenoid-binding protein YceI